MKSPKHRKPLFERLKTGLEEAISHPRGEITLKTTTLELPEAPPEIDAQTLVALRGQSAMSQAVFARMLNVSPKTVQSWEQGVRQPSHASRRLIQIFSQHPETVCSSVGLPAITLKAVAIKQVAPGRRKIVIEDSPGQPASNRQAAQKTTRRKKKAIR
jgi:putative transcriptional regulator